MLKFNLKNKYFNTFKIKDQSDKKKILINLFLYYGLRIFVLSYGIIRIFLINIYLGVSNFGLLNIMMLVAPISLFMIIGFQNKCNFVLYKYALTDDYKSLNKIINEQIKELRFFCFLSLFVLAGLMSITYFFVNSPGLTHLAACLLVLANSIGILSVGIVLPYVQWYLNALNLNYVYDIWEIIFSTIFNIVSFILIILFGLRVFHFANSNYEQGSTYIVLIITFLLTVRFMLANVILNLQKRKYMPWFKREKVGKVQLFTKNNLSYIAFELLAQLSMGLIPLSFFILSIFVHLATMLSGIYYSYMTFVLVISMLGWVITAIKPYMAKYVINNTPRKVYDFNKLLSGIFIFLGILLLINFVIVSPYIMIFSKSYFCFWFAFIIGLNNLVSTVKIVEEAFIYLDGRPEKYWKLTFYEIIVGIAGLIIGLLIVFYVPSFSKDVFNLIYVIITSELIMRFFKYILNLIYLNKFVYHVKFTKFIHDYWLIYLFWIAAFLFIICFLSVNQYIASLQAKYTKDVIYSIFANGSIDFIINDNIHLINFGNLFLALILINLGFITSLVVYIKWFNPKIWGFIKDISISTKNKWEQKILWRKF